MFPTGGMTAHVTTAFAYVHVGLRSVQSSYFTHPFIFTDIVLAYYPLEIQWSWSLYTKAELYCPQSLLLFYRRVVRYCRYCT